jgi:hypothetical protein
MLKISIKILIKRITLQYAIRNIGPKPFTPKPFSSGDGPRSVARNNILGVETCE